MGLRSLSSTDLGSMLRRRPAEEADPARGAALDDWAPPLAAFDLLGGRFAVKNRRRIVLLTAVGLIIVALIGIGVRYAGVRLSLEAAREDQASAQQQLNAARSDAQALAGPGQPTFDDLLTKVEAADTATATALRTEVPVASLAQQILTAATDTGVELTRFEVSVTSEGPKSDARQAEPTTPGESTTVPAKPTERAKVSVSAQSTDAVALQRFMDQLRATPGFGAAKVDLGTGSGRNTVTATVEVPLGDPEHQARVDEALTVPEVP